jgi:hypothetical protein
MQFKDIVLDPCSEMKVLLRIRESFIFFYTSGICHFHSFDCPWNPNLDPCGKSAILAGARKIHVTIVYVFC